MDLIELHILQSFPVTCLNRDDLGAPKTAVFGGAQRARVSSQSWKRAIRLLAREHQQSFFAGTRTRFVLRALTNLFEQEGCDEAKARELAIATADALGKIDKIEKGNVKTLLFFSPREMLQVVREVLATDYESLLEAVISAGDDRGKVEKGRAKLSKLVEKPSRALKSAVKDAADISIFGRMVADDSSLTIEGAGLFSHALSTHRASNEVEFFSAVDDEAADEEAGAGHIGTLEFSSACYYRYVALNLGLLRDEDHLGHLSEDELGLVLDAFLRSSLLAVPEARKNSMFGFTTPSFVLGLRRQGQPLSLANAFERPVEASSKGYVEPSVGALEGHYAALKATYKLDAAAEARLPAVDIDAFIAGLVAGAPARES